MIKENIIAYNTPKSPISEAYRVLRTNLQFASLDFPLQVILVTSSGPSEGKSTTVANLAVTFTQSGSKVLIIDADLRKPRIHKIFGVSNRFGATNAVVDTVNLEDYIQTTEIERLSIMTSGPIPPNPAELLGTNRMKNLLNNLREIFDIILIDSPPVMMVTDAQILSTQSDGVLIVAASGQVTGDALNRSKELLEKVNATILGVIMNKQEYQFNNYYQYYYRSYEDKNIANKKKTKKRKALK
jgi:capsular exopolysaccharide synthesis family protein